MIKSLDKIDFDGPEAFRCKRLVDGMEGKAVQVLDIFKIILPDETEEVMEEHTVIEYKDDEKTGQRSERKVRKKIPVKKLLVDTGTIRGRKGDYVIKLDDGLIMACANVDWRDNRTPVWPTKFQNLSAPEPTGEKTNDS